ncbi:MAG: Dabb family protein [Euzebyales bacterium]|nr:Dabb family protein [Euzebyales bacterium]
MLWHIVTFRFRGDVAAAERDALAAEVRGLPGAIPELALLRVAPAIDDPDVLGVITGFADEAALAVYRDHPEHLPVVARANDLCVSIQRLDMVSDDPHDALPRT